MSAPAARITVWPGMTGKRFLGLGRRLLRAFDAWCSAQLASFCDEHGLSDEHYSKINDAIQDDSIHPDDLGGFTL